MFKAAGVTFYNVSRLPTFRRTLVEPLGIELMTTDELAVVLRRTPQSIRNSRYMASTNLPPHVRVGGRIFYNRASVQKWLAERETHATQPRAVKARKKR